MREMRYCTSCQMEKPAEGFKRFDRYSGGRTIAVFKCASCSARKIPASTKARDDFGKEITARNKSATNSWRRHVRNANTGQMET